MVLGVCITLTDFNEINVPKTPDILEWIRKKNKNITIQFQGNIYDSLSQRWFSIFARTSEDEDGLNPHVLPAPLNEETFVGSIFVFATNIDHQDDYQHNSSGYVNLSIEDYKTACSHWDIEESDDEIEEEVEEEEIEEEIQEDSAPRQFQVKLKPMVINTRNVYVSNPIREKVLENYKEYVDCAEDLECEILNNVVSLCKTEGIDVDWNNRVFWGTYRSKAISVYKTLQTNWIKQLISKEIDCKTFVELPAQEVCPERWKESLDKIIENDKKLYSNSAAASIVLYCSRCKKKAQCDYYQMQTRSADEPMTTFVTCLDCGKKWKF